jgi:hypothetical protein
MGFHIAKQPFILVSSLTETRIRPLIYISSVLSDIVLLFLNRISSPELIQRIDAEKGRRAGRSGIKKRLSVASAVKMVSAQRLGSQYATRAHHIGGE